MIKSKFQWCHNEQHQEIDRTLIQKFNITPIMQQILEGKGIVTESELAALLEDKMVIHDALQLSDMQRAVDRIRQAIANEEAILVYGDYDADGVTSTTIMVDTLRKLGAMVGWYIPNRFTEGYGPSEAAFQNAVDEGVSLIITVDNGIQGHHEIELVQQQGVDVIVTDHHEIGPTMPNAYAIVHPMHPEADYPCSYLCGAGVALKVASALLSDTLPDAYWGLAAIGTVADLVSLTDENRTIVKKGLKVLNESTPSSIKALLEQTKYDDTITEETIGFLIGPRLNAVGRLDDASLAAELLMADEYEEALFLAEQVEHFNQERKEIVNTIAEEALQMAESYVKRGDRFLVLAQSGWHEGVLGIVASRIVETHHLPTMVLNIDEAQGHTKGSARSIEQVSMFDALSMQGEYITKFGGHHMAAGLTMQIEHVDTLREALDHWMKQNFEEGSLQPTKQVDAVLKIEDVTVDNIQAIHRLRPFGMSFQKPVVQLSGLQIQQPKAIGQQQNHLKVTFKDTTLQALFWSHGQLASELMEGQSVDMIGELQINEWNGNRSAQFILADIGSNERQILDYRSKNKKLPDFDNQSDVCQLIHPNRDKETEHQFYYGEIIPEQYEKCVFRDLPLTMEDIETSVEQLKVSQIYLVFEHAKSIYFEGIPQLSVFKQCYKALLQKGHINLAKDGMALCQFLNIKPDILKFILKVFLDLGLITQKDGIIEAVQQTDKRPIESSRVYQARLQRLEVEKQLLYDEFSAIKTWIETTLTRTH
ncbi:MULTISPECIES: single-stranded-DNA-specific exonuclease RecJ [unclassified Staphylococcus]|uniref:single-stranded-DNA-specific exonuclease RecJ n=1 Tax=unclassified Staphylococcus TaxID=91994 RepID=UPI0021CFEEA8|nr:MULTISPECIES: single-stranded-DNA-specific exonuclease RecJ [unclassified Staphylococcus]UXR72579.1 single-stranded-DNA-specific exonuclease RecJ [Staphylococcus sp. IVB6240]UXR74884.1 single-stranded-DNA-specific exonuclease RecJ [Staphylococcus sp. IVB6238]UXR77217.1 single-stranded-DNA-specific exonuclease RecJ [Staphylococcus sp. IVB6233]UXR81341.1 single-stranded-DNA-specific exonuclease RecJ [Staphylococcus sp. IVB6218]